MKSLTYACFPSLKKDFTILKDKMILLYRTCRTLAPVRYNIISKMSNFLPYKLAKLRNVTVILFLLWNISFTIYLNHLRHTVEELTGSTRNKLTLAFQESGGFFTDITDENWNRLRQRVADAEYKCSHICPRDSWLNMLEGWLPLFSCPHERRIGGLGDGGKWVCDPHRIKDQVKTNGCLVYSVGSRGDFIFEEQINEALSNECEMHTFDPSSYAHLAPKYVKYHEWGGETELRMPTDQKAISKHSTKR